MSDTRRSSDSSSHSERSAVSPDELEAARKGSVVGSTLRGETDITKVLPTIIRARGNMKGTRNKAAFTNAAHTSRSPGVLGKLGGKTRRRKGKKSRKTQKRR